MKKEYKTQHNILKQAKDMAERESKKEEMRNREAEAQGGQGKGQEPQNMGQKDGYLATSAKALQRLGHSRAEH